MSCEPGFAVFLQSGFHMGSVDAGGPPMIVKNRQGSPSLPPHPPLSEAGPLDEFGLPRARSLLGETQEEKSRREAAADLLLEKTWQTLVHHLGFEEARRKFLAKTKKPPVKPKGSTRRRLDAFLLEKYDEHSNALSPQGEIEFAYLARTLCKLHPDEFRHKETPEAIAKRISRLVHKRQQDTEKAYLAHMEWQDAYLTLFGHFPPKSLLGKAPGEDK